MMKGLSSGISIAQTTRATEVAPPQPAETPATPAAPPAQQASMSSAGKTALRAESSFSASALQGRLLKQLEAKPPDASVSDAQPQSTRGLFGGFGGWGKFPTVGEGGLSAEVRLDANYQKTLDKNEAKAYFLLPKTLSTGDGDDKVDIRMGSDERIHVNVNGKEAWSGTTREFQALTINTGGGNDVVNNEVDGAKINTGAGDDRIVNNSYSSSIDAGEGNNTVESNGDRNEIFAGGGNDTIRSGGDRNLIATAGGDDTVSSYGDYNYMTTGSGNDDVTVEGSDNKVRTEAGDDRVTISNQYTDGTIENGYYKSGKKIPSERNDVETGDGNDYVSNTASSSTINTGAGNDYVENEGDDATITTNEGQDMVYNSGERATINTGEDDDYVSNKEGAGTLIQTGEGKDTVFVSGNTNYETVGSSGKVRHTVDPIRVETGGDGDTVYNTDGSNLIMDVEPTE